MGEGVSGRRAGGKSFVGGGVGRKRLVGAVGG